MSDVGYLIIVIVSIALGGAGVTIFNRSRQKRSINMDMERDAAVKAIQNHINAIDAHDLVRDVAEHGRVTKTKADSNTKS